MWRTEVYDTVVLAGAQNLSITRLRRRIGLEQERCVCVGTETLVAAMGSGAASVTAVPSIAVDTTEACSLRFPDGAATISEGSSSKALHCLSASAVSFARGVNDTPKIAALLLATRLLAPSLGSLLIGVAMAVGGLLNARRVAETMSRRITAMTSGEALSANLTTAEDDRGDPARVDRDAAARSGARRGRGARRLERGFERIVRIRDASKGCIVAAASVFGGLLGGRAKPVDFTDPDGYRWAILAPRKSK